MDYVRTRHRKTDVQPSLSTDKHGSYIHIICLGSTHWHVSMFDIHLRRSMWVYCPGHTGVKGNVKARRLADKANITGGLRLERCEVLRIFRHYLWVQSRGERRRKRKRSTIFLERTRNGHRQSDQHWNCCKGNIGDTPVDGVERIWGFPSAYIPS